MTQCGTGLCAAVAVMVVALPAHAQIPIGEVPRSLAGTVGQRQTRDQSTINATLTGRISGRLQSRVSSRLQTRIDRNYDVDPDAGDRIRAAADQARIATGPN